MFGKLLIVGAFAFAPLTALAADKPQPQQPTQYRVVTVQPGQGSAITLRIPIQSEINRPEAPYALTGNSAAKPVQLVPMQLGQGGWILVPFSE